MQWRQFLGWCVVATMTLATTFVAHAQDVQSNPFFDSPPGAPYQPSSPGDADTLLATDVGWLVRLLIGVVIVVVLGGALVGWWVWNRSSDETRVRWLESFNEWLLRSQGLQSYYDPHTIRRSIRHYVWPQCTPGCDQAQAAAIPGLSLREQVDIFLSLDSPGRHLFILGPSGSGKTSFLLNYLAENLRRVPRRRTIRLIHLGSHDADDLISKVRFPKRTVLFLDGLDEDWQAVQQGRHKRIVELLGKTRDFARVVITCSAQFLPPEQVNPDDADETTVNWTGEPSAWADRVFRFQLTPWDAGQIEDYFIRRYPHWPPKQRAWALQFAQNNLPQFCTRPLLLSRLADIVDSQRRNEMVTELYASMMDGWIARECGQARDGSVLREFAERLAFDIVSSSAFRQGEAVPEAELLGLMDEWNMEIPIHRPSEHSLICRDQEGNYRFAHRSILEYLFIARLLKQPLPRGTVVALSDLSREFIADGLGRDFLYLPPVTACRAFAPAAVAKSPSNSLSVERHVFVIEERGSVWASGIVEDDQWVVPTVAEALQHAAQGDARLSAQRMTTWTRSGNITDAGLSWTYVDHFPALRGKSSSDSPSGVTVNAPNDAVYLLPGGFAVCSSAASSDDLALIGPGAWSITL